MKRIFTLFIMIVGFSAYISAQETPLLTGEATPEAITYYDFVEWAISEGKMAAWYLDFGTGGPYSSFVDNPATDGINDTDQSLFISAIASIDWWGNFLNFRLETPISITESNRYLHIMHYRENLNDGWSINLNTDTYHEDPFKGTLRFDGNNSTPGVWEDIVIDLKELIDSETPFEKIGIILDKDWSDPKDNPPTDYYFDEIILSDDPLQRGVVILDGTDILNCERQTQMDSLTFDTQNATNTYEIIDNPFTDSWLNTDGKILKFHKSADASWWQGMDIGFPGIHVAEYGVKQYLHVLVRTDTTCFIQLNLKDNLGVEHTEMFLYPKAEIDGDWFDLVMDVSSYAAAIKGFTIRFDVRLDGENYINNTPARDFYADEITFDAEEDPREGTEPIGIDPTDVNKMKVYTANNTIFFETENASKADVFDMLGRNITSVDLKNNSGLNTIEVATRGIYILRVASGSKIHTAKVLVK